MRSIAILALAVSLVACASQPAGDYLIGDALPETFEQQAADCEMRAEQSRTMYGMGGFAGIAAYYGSYNRVFDACMRAKGFHRKES